KGRLYDPSHTRFLTPDPILSDPLNGHDYNPYSYARNSPLNYTDPTGYVTCFFVREGECEEPGSGAGPTGRSPAVNGNGRGWISAQQNAWFASPAVGDNCGGCRENALALLRQAALAELVAYLKKLKAERARFQGVHNTTAATSDAGGM